MGLACGAASSFGVAVGASGRRWAMLGAMVITVIPMPPIRFGCTRLCLHRARRQAAKGISVPSIDTLEAGLCGPAAGVCHAKVKPCP